MKENTEARDMREKARLLRESADAVEKLAAYTEDPKSTDEQKEAALKDVTWALVQLRLADKYQ